MDMRAAKLELARKKLRDHQEKKLITTHKSEVDTIDSTSLSQNPSALDNSELTEGNKNVDNNAAKIFDQSEPLDLNVNVTQILVANKRNLEEQVAELQLKCDQLDSDYKAEINNHNNARQQVLFLQNELKDLMDKYGAATENSLLMSEHIKELNNLKTSLSDDNNNLTEQLEFTKSILTSKETENTSLLNQLHFLQNELDCTKLQLQQLTSGSNVLIAHNDAKVDNQELIQKIKNLEELLKGTQKEKDQINTHYEHYVAELNQQLKTTMLKNEEFSKEICNLSNRESSLIDQISEMEIRLQSVQGNHDKTVEITTIDNGELKELHDKCTKAQNELQDCMRKYEELSDLYKKSELRVQELQEEINSNKAHDNISLTKLTADIASDKIAAQRATEQNKKLKTSIQELEESFVKMSQDKLELTEKLAAEKFLNRELTIKLADIEERSKDLHVKLRAKDEEMIRLQMNYREMEKELENKFNDVKKTYETTTHCDSHEQKESLKEANSLLEANFDNSISDTANNNASLDEIIKKTEKLNIPKEDAMIKLQERFLKIMGEVADLSDEKHNLEHIILQLQNETDTICEYVALYQQQRSLLKKRDEERNAQIKLFQIECDRLKTQLEELSRIILKFAEDKELFAYFQVEHRKNDMEKIRNLLVNLKNNTLINPKSSLELSNVYPCNCCSGNLIDV
ncbi:golgin subfamily A member 2-like [Ostrinia nubilalis]|uniref:golgin subfamily A member 2-like n=1 Tax=Ostrinia nubilalis TaxID=29057 RepID=UPI0030824F35